MDFVLACGPFCLHLPQGLEPAAEETLVLNVTAPVSTNLGGDQQKNGAGAEKSREATLGGARKRGSGRRGEQIPKGDTATARGTLKGAGKVSRSALWSRPEGGRGMPFVETNGITMYYEVHGRGPAASAASDDTED